MHNSRTPKTEYVGFQRAVSSGGCKTSGESAVLKKSKEENRVRKHPVFIFRFLSPKSPLDVRSTPDGAIFADSAQILLRPGSVVPSRQPGSYPITIAGVLSHHDSREATRHHGREVISSPQPERLQNFREGSTACIWRKVALLSKTP